MSVRTARMGAPILSACTIVAGCAVLTWRLRLAVSDDPLRSAAVAVTLSGVLLAALLVPTERTAGHHILPVTVAGLTVAAAAGVVAGPRPPVPWAATAVPLAVLAAVAEEALFRRALYGRLLRFGPIAAIATSALAFALLHVPAYGWVAFPIDLGAGLLFGWQRHVTETWATPAWTHAAINVGMMLR